MTEKEVALLETEYIALHSTVERFRGELVTQLNHLLKEDQIYLAVPVESRTKSWKSLEEKLTRRELDLVAVTDLHDLIGLRLVLLFRRDIARVTDILEKTFKVSSKEDTAERLTVEQFGYSSLHYIIQLPDEWLAVPTLRGLKGLKAEIQVRTAAQHIWAASSHVLQYKQEMNVPPPLKRTIYRISALLETVDLEFERVLEEKEEYVNTLKPNESVPLNVDALERVLNETWPVENKKPGVENYSELLSDIEAFGVSATTDLMKILEKHKEEVMAEDALKAGIKGKFYTHVGLTRMALKREFGKKFTDYLLQKARPRFDAALKKIRYAKRK
jgi:ppGpp synthetase/RelA/SpoT-type nucleotidyltranferase